MKLIRWFFSGEVLFSGFLVGYLLTTVTGGFIVFSHIFMILSFMSFLKRLYNKKGILNINFIPFILYVLIFMVMLTSLYHTPLVISGQEKVFLFSTITAWTFFGTFLLIEDKDSLKKLFQGMVFYAFLVSLFTVLSMLGGVEGRVGLGGGSDNVISVARISGLGIISVVGLFFLQWTKGYKKLIGVVLLFLLIFSLFGTASRGPLIALAISLVIFIPLAFRFSLKELSITYNKGIVSLFLLFGAIVTFLTSFIKRGYFDTMLDRVNALRLESAVWGRTTRFEAAAGMFSESPILGKGIGSFSYFYRSSEIIDYPHNIFLELSSELGLFGLFLFLVLLTYSFLCFFRYFKTNRLNEYQIVIFISVIYLLINANVSGDINGNRLLFAFLALMVMTPRFSETDDTVQ